VVQVQVPVLDLLNMVPIQVARAAIRPSDPEDQARAATGPRRNTVPILADRAAIRLLGIPIPDPALALSDQMSEETRHSVQAPAVLVLRSTAPTRADLASEQPGAHRVLRQLTRVSALGASVRSRRSGGVGKQFTGEHPRSEVGYEKRATRRARPRLATRLLLQPLLEPLHDVLDLRGERRQNCEGHLLTPLGEISRDLLHVPILPLVQHDDPPGRRSCRSLSGRRRQRPDSAIRNSLVRAHALGHTAGTLLIC
jgi:hypothetical protein